MFHLLEPRSHKWKILIDNISKLELEAWLRGDFFAGFCGGSPIHREEKSIAESCRACHGADKRDLV